MAKISRSSVTDRFQIPGLQMDSSEIDGWTVSFETYTDELDLRDYFAGLPDDACQCPHYGFVQSGRLMFHYTDGTDDDIRAGEAYCIRPGHTPHVFPDTSVVEFSPTAELAKTIEVVGTNMANAGLLSVDISDVSMRGATQPTATSG